MKIIRFIKYIILDFLERRRDRKNGIIHFREYGMRLYSGAQGGGKTISLVRQLEEYRLIYPDLFIATNFGYIHENMSITNFEDLEKLPKWVRENGYTGLVIGWDEIQNDFDNQNRNFPIKILRTITQQRKQGIKILATSQFFSNVQIKLRQQTFEVVECKTLASRWTFNRMYDAREYELALDSIQMLDRMRPIEKFSFIQDNEVRELFDSYAVIDNLINDDENLTFDERLIIPAIEKKEVDKDEKRKRRSKKRKSKKKRNSDFKATAQS